MKVLYNCEQVAERYGVTVNAVWGWIRNHKLPAVKIGKGYRINYGFSSLTANLLTPSLPEWETGSSMQATQMVLPRAL